MLFDSQFKYNFCTTNATDILSLDLGGDLWYLIEAIGVSNRSTNATLALQFVNWWLSGTIQALIPDHEWMFPAELNVTLPACFNGRYPLFFFFFFIVGPVCFPRDFLCVRNLSSSCPYVQESFYTAWLVGGF